MAKAPRRKPASVPLEIEIRNFGPISRGKFRLKPLTVFVGPNNAGKTFAATLVHSVLSARSGGANHPELAEWIKPRLCEARVRELVSGVQRAMRAAKGGALKVPQRHRDKMLDLALEHRFEMSILNTIRENFGAELGSLVRIGSRGTRISIRHHINVDIEIRKTGKPVVRLAPGKEILHANREAWADAPHSTGARTEVLARHNMVGMPAPRGNSTRQRATRDKKPLQHVLAMIDNIGNLVEAGMPTSYCLPSVRSGVLCARNPIVSGIISASRYGADVRQDTPMTGVMCEYVDSIASLSNNAPSVNRNGKQDMFGDLFGGRLDVRKPKVGLPQIMYSVGDATIPLNLLSSSISETAPMQLFLQNSIPQTDLLVLEEPEAHLHPETQTRLAKHIVRMVNRGVCVLLITHGVYFLEQLSMFVRLSQIPAKERKKLGFDESDCLDVGDVAPYMFKKSTDGGYAIQEVEHTPTVGISQDEFGRVMDSMYDKEFHIDRIIGDS